MRIVGEGDEVGIGVQRSPPGVRRECKIPIEVAGRMGLLAWRNRVIHTRRYDRLRNTSDGRLEAELHSTVAVHSEVSVGVAGSEINLGGRGRARALRQLSVEDLTRVCGGRCGHSKNRCEG